ncbi:Ig-like domain-containing protein [uncultured Proteiniphilum sp.]|uniref:Ig-like domain-containing protein n=1 Tax=uncultured Proteiniphilum sp. TaxID=497637 RepID=UPI002611E088|nr:Ig-like domain-containing protein [uncultured Proteiniphilum sp.]
MNKIVKTVAYLFLIGCFSGCDPYERTAVEQSIYVNHQSLNMLVGDQMQLTASPTEVIYNWVSEDPTVATVNSSGLVEAMGEGSTNIIAYYSDIQIKVPVAVSQRIRLENIEFAESAIELAIGGKSTLAALPVPGNANDFSRFFWSSDNENVVVVDLMGQITAVSPGVANITVKGGEISRTIEVKVFRNMNVALQKPVRVSSVYAAQYVGENAVDGILNTSDSSNRWLCQSTNSGPQWIEVDLGAEYEIHSLEFWVQSGYPSIDFQFQKEVNGEWEDIFSQIGNANAVYSRTFEATMANKVRLYFTKGSLDGIVRMYEMRVNAKVYE